MSDTETTRTTAEGLTEAELEEAEFFAGGFWFDPQTVERILADRLAAVQAERDALRERVEALIAANERTAPGNGGAVDAGIDAADRAWRYDLRAALDADR